jgi:maleate isomerase
MIGLSTDRIGVWDTERYLEAVPGVAVFSTRIPMSPVATPETLAAMQQHLTSAAALLVPGSRLDVVGFSCTSGTVAIGLENVRSAIHAVRPEAKVSTPIEAGAKALRALKVKRVSLLTPYRVETASLISRYFLEAGFAIDRCATFGLDGDIQMNRVSGDSLVAAASACLSESSDALFISCTGLHTSTFIDRIEQTLQRPVVTSNQAIAWDCLRQSGLSDRVDGKGLLFAQC